MLGGTIHDTLLAEFHRALLTELGWDLVLLAIVGLTVFFGVALSTRTQLVLAAISITVVTAFFIYVIARVGSANDVGSTFEPSKSPHAATGVLFGVLYGVLLFTGFETAANLGEETRQPGRDIPRAVLFSVLAVTGFYLLGSYRRSPASTSTSTRSGRRRAHRCSPWHRRERRAAMAPSPWCASWNSSWCSTCSPCCSAAPRQDRAGCSRWRGTAGCPHRLPGSPGAARRSRRGSPSWPGTSSRSS